MPCLPNVRPRHQIPTLHLLGHTAKWDKALTTRILLKFLSLLTPEFRPTHCQNPCKTRVTSRRNTLRSTVLSRHPPHSSRFPYLVLSSPAHSSFFIREGFVLPDLRDFPLLQRSLNPPWNNLFKSRASLQSWGFLFDPIKYLEFSRWLSGKESACQCRRHRLDPWVRKSPSGRKWHSISVFLPGKSHGQRSWPQSTGSQKSQTRLSD